MSMNKLPFFARFLEAQELEEVNAGGPIHTMKFPSDSDEAVTKKYPSDSDEFVTMKYPSDSDEYVTMKYPSDSDEATETM